MADTSSLSDPLTPGEKRPQADTNIDLAVSLAQFSESAVKTALAVSAWLMQCGERQQPDSQRVEETLAKVQAALDAIQSGLHLETARNLETIRSLAQRQDTLDHNLEQVRRLAESLDRKVERLAGDFIERQVTLPLFKHLASLWFSLRSLANAPQPLLPDELHALADEVERLLDLHGILVLLPIEGQPLDPHAHQPVQTRPTDNPALHGCIAGNFQPGLRNAQRVIQPARVAVFTCNQQKPKEIS